MLGISDEKWKEMSEAERKAAIKREYDELFWVLDALADGRAVRHAGLIYRLPICHDAYGESL